ncbi:MerR family transcriptional regulator [Lentzea aerocolonigenes]|uniref:MerR family transcriptional regulator n=1 Tax=Lentzea aerocolonigenes TaxID=68170 RepID=UPI000691367A|nr:MerR family transcriptional regulator [Lentzea aerocolonigenes]MCP2248790.1 MerR HTH family regulatory protein [Lentzea aerocolonigenes]
MRIAELSRRTGVPVPTIKYYLREGLLEPGARTSPNQAFYGESHVRRLRLIRALVDIGGQSVGATKSVLKGIDEPGISVHAALGAAQYAMTTTRAPVVDEAWKTAARTVAELVAKRGWDVKETNPSQQAMTEVVATLLRLGQDHWLAVLDTYTDAAESIAERELAELAGRADIDDITERAIVVTVLGDVLLSALRRLAQEHVSRTHFDTVCGTPAQET